MDEVEKGEGRGIMGVGMPDLPLGEDKSQGLHMIQLLMTDMNPATASPCLL